MIDKHRMNLERASLELRAAANTMGIEFYATEQQNRPAELNCRIFVMTPVDLKLLEQFAKDLNKAIEPVKVKLATALRMQAKSILDGEAADQA